MTDGAVGNAGRDRGAQVERTLLAWQRTALAAGFNAALLLRAALAEDVRWASVPAGLLAAAAVATWVAAARAYAHVGAGAASGLLLTTRPRALAAGVVGVLVGAVNIAVIAT